MTPEEFLHLNDTDRSNALSLMKKNMLSDEEMYRKMGIIKELAYGALRKMRGHGGFSPKIWTDDNLTCGYCHRMTAVAIQEFNSGGCLVPLQVYKKKEKINHFFLVLIEGKYSCIIDLTRHQMRKHGNVSDGSLLKNFPYEEARILSDKQMKDLTLPNKPAAKFVLRFMKIYQIA